MAEEIDVYKEWLGIPEGDRPPDHYTLLRLVMFEDDPDKIRGNYRKLNNHVRKYATGQYLQQSQDLLNELAKAMLCLTDPSAKHDYDELLGRDPAEAAEEEAQTTLQYLVAKGLLKRNQVNEVEHFAEARGLSHRDALVQMKLAESDTATQAMAVELRMPFVDLDDMLPEEDVLDRVPKNIVKRHTCLPLFEDNGRLLVACADEPAPELEDELRLRFGVPMRGVLAVPRSINQAIAKYYAPGERDDSRSVADVDPAALTSRKKSSGESPAKSKKKQPAGTLSDEERTNRRNISLIIICWSLIVPMVAMGLLGDGSLPMYVQFAISAAIAGAVAGVLKLTYWK